MKSTQLVALLSLGLLVFLPAYAHPGRTDGSGGHTCNTNCTEKWHLQYGEYHNHNSGGGYTNSQGQTFDKAGNPVAGSSASKPAPTPTPTPAPVKPTQQPAPVTQKVTTPTPTPVISGDVLGTTEEATPTPEPSPEPSPTPSPTPEPTQEPSPSPIAEADTDESSGGVAATLGTLAVLGGGGYYLYRRIRRS